MGIAWKDWQIMNLKLHLNDFLIRVRRLATGFLGLFFLMHFSISFAENEDWVYTVRPGDTLWSISENYLLGTNYWPKLKQYNNVADTLKLKPGERIFVPVAWLKIPPQPVEVQFVSGQVHYFLPNQKQAKIVTAGKKLSLGTTIKIFSESSLSLSFADGSTMLISQNSELRLDKLTIHEGKGMVDTSVSLPRGRVETNVIPFKNEKSRFEIHTPAAVASVRGTQFRVSMNEKTATMHGEVIKGEISVENAGVTQIVPSGFGVVSVKGKPPVKPVVLLEAPQFTNFAKKYFTNPVLFDWHKVKNAIKYRIQVASTSKFKTLHLDIQNKETKTSWQWINPGKYIIRIRGISDMELEGKNSDHEFVVLNALPTPKSIFPKNKSRLEKALVNFQWLGDADVNEYLLQVSLTEDFSSTIIEVYGHQMHYSHAERLSSGKYYWRVANVYENNIVGEFGEITEFEISE